MARHVVVVGAGPVGCLAALALAKRGWRVSVYEGRPGMINFAQAIPTFINGHVLHVPQTLVRLTPKLHTETVQSILQSRTVAYVL